MKFCVNENCIGCGLCVGICPEVFEMTEVGFAHAMEQEISAMDAIKDSALEAKNSCPVAAIEIVDV